MSQMAVEDAREEPIQVRSQTTLETSQYAVPQVAAPLLPG